MPNYRDLHDHLALLEEHGLLVRVKRAIQKETELHPLVRWQYRGLKEEQRKAFLKARNRIGLYPMAGQHIYIHWEKCKKRVEGTAARQGCELAGGDRPYRRDSVLI